MRARGTPGRWPRSTTPPRAPLALTARGCAAAAGASTSPATPRTAAAVGSPVRRPRFRLYAACQTASQCDFEPDGGTCPMPDGGDGTCCQSTCADLQSDPDNCGACGRSCSSSESCLGGACGLVACDPSHSGRSLLRPRGGRRGADPGRRAGDSLRLRLHRHLHRPGQLRRLRPQLHRNPALRRGGLQEPINPGVG